MKHMYSKLSTP